MTAAERWLPHPEWTGHYLVSSHGRVWSLARRQCDGRVRAGMMLSPSPDSGGYLCVTLSRDGRSVTRRVHDLVAETFIGPKPAGKQVRHLTGDQRVNRSDKLRYGSQSQNERDKRRYGRRLAGETTVTGVTGVTGSRVSWLVTAAG